MDLKDKVILVTGGAGAVGSNLVLALIEKKCKKIIVLDDFSSGYEDNLPKSNLVTVYKGDVCDSAILKKIFSQGVEVVFHLAANFANQNSVDDPVKDLKTNGEGTLKVLMFSKEYKVKKFVFSSSSCVYGNKQGLIDETNIAYDLETPYAITKLLGEHYCMFFHRIYGLPIVVLRYFNSYGPGERAGLYRNVVPNMIATALQKKPLTITGTGNETRDFTLVSDIVQGTILSAEKEAAIGEVINLGSGREIKIIDLANKINKMTGNTAGIVYKERRNWDSITRRQAAVEKAKKLLGYKPTQDMDEGLELAIAWMKTKK